MRKKISLGLRSVIIILIIVYLTEAVILSVVYRFLSKLFYKLVAPPVVIAAMAVAWLTIYIDMMKKGGR
jgi:hypothetical protein